ncbi:hypothetical protein B0H21DRAFT_706872 [Amylocystis lapponica]|nr:hypothetical protein B0H21DRAFT_706872 [Amylocystis lapponica]
MLNSVTSAGPDDHHTRKADVTQTAAQLTQTAARLTQAAAQLTQTTAQLTQAAAQIDAVTAGPIPSPGGGEGRVELPYRVVLRRSSARPTTRLSLPRRSNEQLRLAAAYQKHEERGSRSAATRESHKVQFDQRRAAKPHSDLLVDAKRRSCRGSTVSSRRASTRSRPTILREFYLIAPRAIPAARSCSAPSAVHPFHPSLPRSAVTAHKNDRRQAAVECTLHFDAGAFAEQFVSVVGRDATLAMARRGGGCVCCRGAVRAACGGGRRGRGTEGGKEVDASVRKKIERADVRGKSSVVGENQGT